MKNVPLLTQIRMRALNQQIGFGVCDQFQDLMRQGYRPVFAKLL